MSLLGLLPSNIFKKRNPLPLKPNMVVKMFHSLPSAPGFDSALGFFLSLFSVLIWPCGQLDKMELKNETRLAAMLCEGWIRCALSIPCRASLGQSVDIYIVHGLFSHGVHTVFGFITLFTQPFLSFLTCSVH